MAPRLVLGLYVLFLLVPIYWLVNMSFKTNLEITASMTLWPQQPTLENYRAHLHRPLLVQRLHQLLNLRLINMAISLSVALPAAYAFCRYRFLGDKHLFFWLLSNRMAPPAVFALPFFQLYSAVGLFDTPWAVALAHCVFNIPLAVWILEGFMSGVPREIDETRLYRRLLLPALLRPDLHAADRLRRRRRRLLLLHVLLGRAAARPDPDHGRRQADRRDHDPHGLAPPAWTGACSPPPAC